MENFVKEHYEVDFMNLIVDKADNLKVIDCDSHFSEFVGVHSSKIHQGKVYFSDVIKPIYREQVMRILCKKDSPYVYFDVELVDKNGESIYIHCTGQNYETSTLCRLTLADVSKSIRQKQELEKRAMELDTLIDLVDGGVCLFKVNENMHIEVLYLNEGGCKLFGTTKGAYALQPHGLDELIYPDDRSAVFQAIGRSMATDTPIDLEFRTLVHKDEFRWCKLNAAINDYDNGSPIFHAMLTDVTRVKEAEAVADTLNNKLTLIFKNLPTPVFYTDVDDPLKIVVASKDFMKFTGYSRSYFFDEHDGNLADFISNRELTYVVANIRKQIEQNGKAKLRYSLRVKSGNYIVVEDRRKVVVQADGTRNLLCSMRNVTKKYYDKNDIIE